MSEYENRIFDTLTASEEKFKSAHEIADHLKMVKDKLITQFWNYVADDLKKLVDLNDNEFEVVLDENLFYKNASCSIHIKGNRQAGFIYEHLSGDQWMGLWFDNSLFDMSKINLYREDQKDKITYNCNYLWWLSFKDLHENFSTRDASMMILPNKARDYAKMKADDLFNLAVENKEHLKYIINNCLKDF